jgi:hypothetical protein
MKILWLPLKEFSQVGQITGAQNLANFNAHEIRTQITYAKTYRILKN